MENRDRDKLNKNISSSKQGNVSSDSNADFSKDIGRSEKWDSEPSRRSGSGSSSSSSSSSGSSSGRGSSSEREQ